MQSAISFVISLCLIINDMTIRAFTWTDGSTKIERVLKVDVLLSHTYLYGKPNDARTP